MDWRSYVILYFITTQMQIFIYYFFKTMPLQWYSHKTRNHKNGNAAREKERKNPSHNQ